MGPVHVEIGAGRSIRPEPGAPPPPRRLTRLPATPRPPAAPQQARGAAGGREGPQRAAVLGAGERRAVPRPLLLHPDPRAARRPVGTALSLREPQRLCLRGGQVSRPAQPLERAPRTPGACPPQVLPQPSAPRSSRARLLSSVLTARPTLPETLLQLPLNYPFLEPRSPLGESPAIQPSSAIPPSQAASSCSSLIGQRSFALKFWLQFKS